MKQLVSSYLVLCDVLQAVRSAEPLLHWGVMDNPPNSTSQISYPDDVDAELDLKHTIKPKDSLEITRSLYHRVGYRGLGRLPQDSSTLMTSWLVFWRAQQV